MKVIDLTPGLNIVDPDNLDKGVGVVQGIDQHSKRVLIGWPKGDKNGYYTHHTFYTYEGCEALIDEDSYIKMKERFK